MDYWIMLDGERLGPMSAMEVGQHAVTKDTPVWREGLADWTTLGELPEFQPFFATRDGVNEVPRPEPRPAAPERPRPEGECPASRLGWCIAATLLCCAPLGIVGIFFAAKVTPSWQQGDMAAALRNQERAEWCVILAIVLGLLFVPVQMAFMAAL